MTPSEIKSALKNKGMSQYALAKKWSLPAGTISQLVNRKFKSRRLEKRLARLLGVTLEDLRGCGAQTGNGHEEQASDPDSARQV